jgi:hypothetical protein
MCTAVLALVITSSGAFADVIPKEAGFEINSFEWSDGRAVLIIFCLFHFPIWCALCGVLAHVAGARCRSRAFWFFFSLLLISPVISLIVLMVRIPNFNTSFLIGSPLISWMILLVLPNLRLERSQSKKRPQSVGVETEAVKLGRNVRRDELLTTFQIRPSDEVPVILGSQFCTK